jgi:hypothetical protein
MSRSDGSTADYYELPAGCTQLQDLISYRDMNAQIGEIVRACYRYGIVSHSDKLRDAKKIRFYADAEVKRLEKLLDPQYTGKGCGVPAPFLEPAAAIDDDSDRATAIGQNGNSGEHYMPPIPWDEFTEALYALPVNGKWLLFAHELNNSRVNYTLKMHGIRFFEDWRELLQSRPTKDAK